LNPGAEKGVFTSKSSRYFQNLSNQKLGFLDCKRKITFFSQSRKLRIFWVSGCLSFEQGQSSLK